MPNLPSATGLAYTIENVKKGFLYNGQIDDTHCSVPCIDNLINTFRGDVQDTCLDNKQRIIETFFEEMYLNGCISEGTYDIHNIPKDINSHDVIVDKPECITQENRHRAKILSSESQIKERRKLVDTQHLNHYLQQKRLYETERKVIVENDKFEKNITKLIQQQRTNDNGILHDAYPLGGNVIRPTVTYRDIHHLVTQDFVDSNKKSFSVVALLSFVKIRAKRSIRGGKLTFFDIPKGKERLLVRFFEDKDKLPVDQIYVSVPSAPVLLEPPSMAFDV